MQEVALKTHLICTGIHEEYFVKWYGKIKNVKPYLKNELPVFIIVSSEGRVELNTIDIKFIEDCAKNFTHPHGHESITSDVARIYILEEDDKETLMGKVFHTHIKQYQQMYDKFERI